MRKQKHSWNKIKWVLFETHLLSARQLWRNRRLRRLFSGSSCLLQADRWLLVRKWSVISDRCAAGFGSAQSLIPGGDASPGNWACFCLTRQTGLAAESELNLCSCSLPAVKPPEIIAVRRRGKTLSHPLRNDKRRRNSDRVQPGEPAGSVPGTIIIITPPARWSQVRCFYRRSCSTLMMMMMMILSGGSALWLAVSSRYCCRVRCVFTVSICSIKQTSKFAWRCYGNGPNRHWKPPSGSSHVLYQNLIFMSVRF